MKRLSFLAGFMILGLLLITGGRPETDVQNPRVASSLSKNITLKGHPFAAVPLYFVPNKGQLDGEALFYSKTPSYTLWMTKKELVFDSSIKREKAPDRKDRGVRTAELDTGPSAAARERDVSRIIFLNANPSPEVKAQDPSQYRVNYFLGSDPDKWRTNIETSQAVLYKELYPKIDLKVYGLEKQIEYDWMVKPGGAVEDIRFEYRNIKKTEIDHDGNLIIGTEFGELMHRKPDGYQIIDGQKRSVQVAFRTIASHTFGFKAEARDPAFPLIIDPQILVYSTYLGGADGDGASDIAVDSAGSVYIAGGTWSSNFPVSNPFDSTRNGIYDIVVTKFAPDGRGLAYSTYLGGSSWDDSSGIAIDSTGTAYVIGRTTSSDFPVFNAYDPSFNGGSDDVFIAKISPLGNILVYSTFLGGLSTETGGGIAVDSSGFAYVTGVTDSPDFPVVDAFDPYWNGGSDIFVAKLTPDGGALVYSTFLGGASVEMGGDICVDSACSAYVTGTTYSLSFPVVNAYDPTWNGFADVFVAKFAPEGKSLVYSTFVGGSDSDICYSLSVDSYGSAYITGMTSSSNFPVVNAYDPAKNGQADAFVTKLTPDGKALAYSTYLGGTNTDNGSSIAVDGAGSAYVIGYTYSLDFPVRYPVSPALKGYFDSFVAKFTPAGQSLAFSTYLGGSGGDYGWAIAVDGAHDVYLTGNTDSSDFPLSNAYDLAPNGNTDIFVTKLCVVPPYPPNNFNLQSLQNNYIFYKEYVHRLTWTANPENPSKIIKFRLYRKVKDAPDTTYQRIAEVSAATFSYDDRGLKKTALYKYRITSVDELSQESFPAEAGN